MGFMQLLRLESGDCRTQAICRNGVVIIARIAGPHQARRWAPSYAAMHTPFLHWVQAV